MKIYGLPNLSNTCFLNSAVQLLMSSEELFNKLCNCVSKEDTNLGLYFSNLENNRRKVCEHLVKILEDKKEDYRLGNQFSSLDFINVIINLTTDVFDTIKINKVLYRYNEQDEMGNPRSLGNATEEEIQMIVVEEEDNSLREALAKKLYLRNGFEGVDVRVFTKIPNQVFAYVNRFKNRRVSDKKIKMPVYTYFIENGIQIPYKLKSYIFHTSANSGGTANSGHYVCERYAGNKWFHISDNYVKQEDTGLRNIDKGFIYLYERQNEINREIEEVEVTLEYLRNCALNQEDYIFSNLFTSIDENKYQELVEEDPNLRYVLDDRENLYAYLLDGTILWKEEMFLGYNIEFIEKVRKFKQGKNIQSLLLNGKVTQEEINEIFQTE